MEVQLMIAVMGVLTVTAVYFWLIRAKPDQAETVE